QFNDYYNNGNYSQALSSDINLSTVTNLGHSSAEADYGVTQAYPIMDEPNTYSMDQLKYNLFLQLMQAMFKDDSTMQTQGDHAATLLGNWAMVNNNPTAPHQYLVVEIDPSTGSSLANTHTYISTFAPTDATWSLLKS